MHFPLKVVDEENFEADDASDFFHKLTTRGVPKLDAHQVDLGERSAAEAQKDFKRIGRLRKRSMAIRELGSQLHDRYQSQQSRFMKSDPEATKNLMERIIKEQSEQITELQQQAAQYEGLIADLRYGKEKLMEQVMMNMRAEGGGRSSINNRTSVGSYEGSGSRGSLQNDEDEDEDEDKIEEDPRVARQFKKQRVLLRWTFLVACTRRKNRVNDIVREFLMPSDSKSSKSPSKPTPKRFDEDDEYEYEDEDRDSFSVLTLAKYTMAFSQDAKNRQSLREVEESPLQGEPLTYSHESRSQYAEMDLLQKRMEDMEVEMKRAKFDKDSSNKQLQSMKVTNALTEENFDLLGKLSSWLIRCLFVLDTGADVMWTEKELNWLRTSWKLLLSKRYISGMMTSLDIEEICRTIYLKTSTGAGGISKINAGLQGGPNPYSRTNSKSLDGYSPMNSAHSLTLKSLASGLVPFSEDSQDGLGDVESDSSDDLESDLTLPSLDKSVDPSPKLARSGSLSPALSFLKGFQQRKGSLPAHALSRASSNSPLRTASLSPAVAISRTGSCSNFESMRRDAPEPSSQSQTSLSGFQLSPEFVNKMKLDNCIDPSNDPEVSKLAADSYKQMYTKPRTGNSSSGTRLARFDYANKSSKAGSKSKTDVHNKPMASSSNLAARFIMPESTVQMNKRR